jgi:hypothetical protein
MRGAKKSRPFAKAMRSLLGGGLLTMASFHPGVAQTPDPLQVVKDDSSVTVKRGDRSVLKYLYSKVPYKPYVSELYTPSGINVIRDSPPDHKHHHGLMFAIKVDGVNFWEEANSPGTEKHVGEMNAATSKGKDIGALLTEQLDWLGPDQGPVLLKESRMITVHPEAGPKVTLLSWGSNFSLPEGKASAVLTGTLYHGLGLRFLESMDKAEGFFNAEGKTGVEGTNDQRSSWCAFTAEADGKPVTIALFDLDKNPRHPATWFTMNTAFSYMSATLNLSREPFDLQQGKSLTLVYGVALWDGKVDRLEVERTYRLWLGAAAK